MGGRGGPRRFKDLPVDPNRRILKDRREKDIDPLLDSQPYAGFSNVKKYPSGKYKSLVTDVPTGWDILGVQVNLAAKKIVEFYENGDIKACVLDKTSKLPVNGVSAKVAKMQALEFHENGRVKKLTLLKESSLLSGLKFWKYNGIEIPTGTTVEFSEDGEIKRSGAKK